MVGLLLAILVALVVLITLRLARPGQTKPPPPEPPAVASDTTARRAELPKPPEKPKPVGNPDRIREIVQQGKTYRQVVNGAVDAKVEDKDWGVGVVVNMGFRFEMVLNRTIEANDGRRVTETRHFEVVRSAKVLSEVANVQVDELSPGILALGALEFVSPGAGATAVAVGKPFLEGFLASAVQTGLDNYKAYGQVDSLSGKKVRVVYADGVGVEEVTPIGCDLSKDERDFVFNTASLVDYHVLPDVQIKVGNTWSVDGRELIGFLDPSLRGVPRGEIVLIREPDREDKGRTFATLRIQSGEVVLDSSTSATTQIGSFVPRGRLHYNIDGVYVESARLDGDFHVEKVSKDHLFYEASFKTSPRLKIVYECTVK